MANFRPRVCSFESRRKDEMARFIERFGGEATVAPSMQEVTNASQPAVEKFAEMLTAGEIDITIFLTGVGTTALFEALSEKFSDEEINDLIQKTCVAARGPKPMAVLSKRNITADFRAPEPNTWEELVEEFRNANLEIAGKIVAIQEYGIPSHDLHKWLESQTAKPLSVPIYKWELPDDLEPLKAAILATVAGEFDILLWTSAQQVVHVLEVASQMGLQEKWIASARKCVNASIGPATSTRLREKGIEPSFEPTHPKMAHLAREAMEYTASRND